MVTLKALVPFKLPNLNSDEPIWNLDDPGEIEETDNYFSKFKNDQDDEKNTRDVTRLKCLHLFPLY